MSATDKPVTGLAKMREPFPERLIGKLPKPVKARDEDKGRCERGSRYSADGYFCGGWHARSVHLDYAGHAAITDRLLDADPEWDWQPAYRKTDNALLAQAMATGNPEIVRMVIENSPPLIDSNGGMWMKLTVDGVTRMGYGDAAGKSGANAVKELIGDGLRNAAMRFGGGLELWHKGDLHAPSEEPEAPQAEQQPARPTQAVTSPARNWPVEAKAIVTSAEPPKQQFVQLGLLMEECERSGQMTPALKKKFIAEGKTLQTKIEAAKQPAAANE